MASPTSASRKRARARARSGTIGMPRRRASRRSRAARPPAALATTTGGSSPPRRWARATASRVGFTTRQVGRLAALPSEAWRRRRSARCRGSPSSSRRSRSSSARVIRSLRRWRPRRRRRSARPAPASSPASGGSTAPTAPPATPRAAPTRIRGTCDRTGAWSARCQAPTATAPTIPRAPRIACPVPAGESRRRIPSPGSMRSSRGLRVSGAKRPPVWTRPARRAPPQAAAAGALHRSTTRCSAASRSPGGMDSAPETAAASALRSAAASCMASDGPAAASAARPSDVAPSPTSARLDGTSPRRRASRRRRGEGGRVRPLTEPPV